MGRDIRVFLVDDHEVAREGLRRMLELEPDIKIVGEASNAEEALLKVEPLSPDIVLMDIKMPRVNGLELTRQFTERGLAATVIIMSLHSEYLAQAVEAGAGGYLVKDVKRAELVDAVRRAAEGEMVLGGSLMNTPEITESALVYLRNVLRGRDSAKATSAHNGPSPAQQPQPPREEPPPQRGQNGYTGVGMPGEGAQRLGLRAEESGPPRSGEPPIDSSSMAPLLGLETDDGQGQEQAADRSSLEWAELGRGSNGSIANIVEGHSPAFSSAEPVEDEEDEGEWARRSSGDSVLYESTVELAIEPPVDADALLKLCQWLRRTARADIQETVGSWDEGTSIRVVLRRPMPLLEMLMSSPDVAKVWEEPTTAQPSGHRFLGERKREPGSVAKPTKRLRLVIQSSSSAKQLPLGFDMEGSQ